MKGDLATIMNNEITKTQPVTFILQQVPQRTKIKEKLARAVDTDCKMDETTEC